MTDDLERDVQETREHLAETLSALGDKGKADVKVAGKIGGGVAAIGAVLVGFRIWRRRR